MIKGSINLAGPVFLANLANKFGDFSHSEFVTWVAILAFLIFFANQIGDFWRKNLKAQPPASDVARDLVHLEKTITSGIRRVEDSFNGQINRIEKNMNDRFDAAFKSRTGIHKDQDLIRERMARVEVEVENLKQRDALKQIRNK